MTLRALPLVCLLASVPSLAQVATVPEFSLERLSPDPANVNSLVVSTGDNLSPQTLRASLVLQYERDPLVYFKNGERVGALISSRTTAFLGVAYGLTDWLELAAQLPLVLEQHGADLTAEGIAPAGASLVGSPLLQGRLAMLSEAHGSPIDLGVTMGVTIPVGSDRGLYRDPASGFSVIPRLGAGRRLGRWLRVGAEVGAVIRGQATLSPFSTSSNDEVGSMMSVGATATTLGEGLRGALDVRDLVPFTHTGSSFEVLAGLRYPLLGHKLEVFGLGGPGFGGMPGTPAYRVLAGLAWTPFESTPQK